MQYEPHLITPFEKSGLSKYYKPFLIGEEAFPVIEDAYPYRGNIRKREGFRLLGTFPNGDAPVQGLKNWVNPSTLSETLIGFSQTKSYVYNTSSLLFVDITQLNDGTTFSFGNGTDDYYWASNYAGSMWVANGLGLTTAGVPSAVNGILFLTSNTTNSWNIHQPLLNITPGMPPVNTYLNGALIILPYKGRLVVLNTIEGIATGVGNTSFPNRARWSERGSPYVSTGGGHPTVLPSNYVAVANSWRDDIPGYGGFTDADTNERIVSAEIVKDTLIVFFQRSTWRLRYTGNEILPFIWERLNTQYGAESTYSNIAFDDAALAFSRFGWIAANTNDVARIDENIPDDAFTEDAINTNFTGLRRVQGIRDFYRQYAYWTFDADPSASVNQIYAFDYINKTWSIFNPSVSIRTFGYYHTLADSTWSVLSTSTDTWDNYNNSDDIWSAFGTGSDIDFPYIVGGDVSGNVYQMFEFFGAASTDNGTNFPFTIETKRFNPYFQEGLKCRVGYVDLYFTDAPGGEMTFNYYIDDYDPTYADPFLTREVPLSVRGQVTISSITLGATTTINTVTPHLLINNQITNMSGILGTAGLLLNNYDLVATVITPTQFTVNVNTSTSTYIANTGVVFSSQLSVGQAKYTRLFFNVTANFHQFVMTLSPAQLNDPVKGAAQFQLQAIILWTMRAARIKG